MTATFASLPLEIRLQIWALCIPSPRILAFKLDSSRKPDLYSQNAQPILLSINHESREYLLGPNGGGYVLIRVFDIQVAFHPHKDSVCFLDGSPLRNKVLVLSAKDSETLRNKKLATKEKMLTCWMEDSGHGDRLRNWLMDHIDVLGMVSMLQEDGLNGAAMSKITEFVEQLDDREGVPWVMSEYKPFDTDPFCRELLKKG